MKNRLKQLLADGKPALGTWIGFSDPYSVEVLADAGFDWLLIDMEHFPMSKEALRTILMACKGSDSTPVVRVPVNSVDYIQAALDLGAQGVMTPMVNSASDAKRGCSELVDWNSWLPGADDPEPTGARNGEERERGAVAGSTPLRALERVHARDIARAARS